MVCSSSVFSIKLFLLARLKNHPLFERLSEEELKEDPADVHKGYIYICIPKEDE